MRSFAHSRFGPRVQSLGRAPGTLFGCAWSSKRVVFGWACGGPPKHPGGICTTFQPTRSSGWNKFQRRPPPPKPPKEVAGEKTTQSPALVSHHHAHPPRLSHPLPLSPRSHRGPQDQSPRGRKRRHGQGGLGEKKKHHSTTTSSSVLCVLLPTPPRPSPRDAAPRQPGRSLGT